MAQMRIMACLVGLLSSPVGKANASCSCSVCLSARCCSWWCTAARNCFETGGGLILAGLAGRFRHLRDGLGALAGMVCAWRVAVSRGVGRYPSSFYVRLRERVSANEDCGEVDASQTEFASQWLVFGLAD